ncbi:MAG: DUF4234 domain-containing protein [Clostridia bacterium]|nr:DUF4234 domain-containing protein [Clostridia bacterium]
MVKRDWKKIWILGIITGGVYNWYVIWCMYNDIKKMENQTNNNNMNFVLYLLLSVCTGSLFAFFVCYTYHKKALALAKTYNVEISIKSPVIFALVAMYLPIISYMIPIKNHNKLIEGYETSYAYKNN